MLLRQLLKLNVNLNRIQIFKKIPSFKSGLTAFTLKEKSLVGFFLETRTFQRLRMVNFLKNLPHRKEYKRKNYFHFLFVFLEILSFSI